MSVNQEYITTGDAAFHDRYAAEYAEMQSAFNEYDPDRQATLDHFFYLLGEGFIKPVIQKKNTFVIQIFEDGVGRSGKSSLNTVLEELGFFIFSTGYYYRALTLYAIENGYIADNDETRSNFAFKLQNLSFSLKKQADQTGQEVLCVAIKEKKSKEYCYGIDTDLRVKEVSANISYIGGLEFVAQKLDKEAVEILSAHRLIAIDSRDNYLRHEAAQEAAEAIKTVSGANLEIYAFYVYVCADLKERARREALRNHKEGVEEIAASIHQRDKGDASRSFGQLLLPDEAAEGTTFKYDYFLDTTKLNIQEGQLFLLAAVYAHIYPESGHLILSSLEEYCREREAYHQTVLSAKIKGLNQEPINTEPVALEDFSASFYSDQFLSIATPFNYS